MENMTIETIRVTTDNSIFAKVAFLIKLSRKYHITTVVRVAIMSADIKVKQRGCRQ